MLPLFSRLTSHTCSSVALSYRNSDGLRTMTYDELLKRSQNSAIQLLDAIQKFETVQQSPTICKSPQNECLSFGRVPLLDIGTNNYVTSLLGTWMAGYASVPLCEFLK